MLASMSALDKKISLSDGESYGRVTAGNRDSHEYPPSAEATHEGERAAGTVE